MAGTTESSSSRTRSSGPGSAKPTASRTTFRRSMGIPVLSLSSWNVMLLSPGNRSNAAHIHEGEGEGSIPNGSGHPLKGDPGPLQALHPPSPEHVSRREPVWGAGRQDPELDQPVDVVSFDPGPLGDLLPRVSAHTSASIENSPGSGTDQSGPTEHNPRSAARRVARILRSQGENLVRWKGGLPPIR